MVMNLTVPYNLLTNVIENKNNQTLFLLPSYFPIFLFCLAKRLTLPSYQTLSTHPKKLDLNNIALVFSNISILSREMLYVTVLSNVKYATLKTRLKKFEVVFVVLDYAVLLHF